MTSPTTRDSRPKRRPKEPTTPPPATTAPPRDRSRVVLAVVAGAHGLAGEVRLKVFADDLAAHASFNDGALTLTGWRNGIARFAEVRDRTAAEALRGTELAVPRTALPLLGEGEYYHADLLGLAVETPAGEPVGRVVAVENFGAGDVIEVERSTGKRFMAPLTPAAVPEWNDARLVIEPAYAQ